MAAWIDMLRSERGKNLLGYLLSVLIPLAVAATVFRVWQWDGESPQFGFRGDALFMAHQVQAALETGSHLGHPRCGAPWTEDLRDFPVSEWIHIFLLQGLHSVVGGTVFSVINLYYLLSFPLTAAIAYFVLRRLKLPRGPALVAACLYAFLPYHLLRGTKHFFLALYFPAPLLVLVLHWILAEPGAPASRPSRWVKILAAGGVCLFMAWTSIYYAFFSCFFLLIAGTLAAFRQRSVRPALAAGACIVTIVVGGMIALWPSLAFTARNGPNDETSHRLANEAEIYGLKLTQLLLPNKNHPIPALRQLREKYYGLQPPGEQPMASLGLVGVVGFLFLLGWCLCRRRDSAPRSDTAWLDGFAILNAAGLLLATVGGIGALVALALPSIRGYNRIVVFLAFFALAAVAAMLTWLFRQRQTRWFQTGLRPLLLAALLAWGLVESAVCVLPFDGEPVVAKYETDRDFAQRAEALLPSGAMVFQLPYYPFPEPANPPGTMGTYDHLEMPLVSTSLRWSAGALRGRSGAHWQALTAALPAKELVDKLSHAGFAAIQLNRQGYADDGAKLEQELHSLLQQEPVVSRDGRLVLYSLVEHQTLLQRSLSESQRAEAQRQALSFPVDVLWNTGFSGEETDGTNKWHWCTAPRGTIRLVNGYGVHRQVRVSFRLLSPRPAIIRFVGAHCEQEITVNSPDGALVEFTLDLAQERVDLQFRTNARGQQTPPDGRLLYFQVRDFQLMEESPPTNALSLHGSRGKTP